MSKERKLSLDIVKNNVKFESKNCKIHEDLLYINNKLYILNVLNFRIKIIKNIYNISFDEHANKSFIYN